MHFSPTDIEYFLAVARHGHLGRAAAQCGVTQPAITKALRRLEDTTGVALFERGAHGARLTPEGQLFQEHARRLNLQQEELAKVASELRAHHRGLLRIGVTNPTGDSAPVRMLADMLRRRPGMRLQLVIGKSDTLNAAVQAGDLDIAVVPNLPGIPFSCDQIDVGADAMQVVARAGHPVFKTQSPTLATLQPYAWILPSRDSAARQVWTRLHEQAGLPEPSVMVEVQYTSEALLGLVANTDLLALAPMISLRPWAGKIHPIAVRELALTRRLLLLTRPGAHHSVLMAEFLALMRQSAHDAE